MDLARRYHIGDTPMDLQAAEGAGAEGIGVTTGVYTREELQAVSPGVSRSGICLCGRLPVSQGSGRNRASQRPHRDLLTCTHRQGGHPMLCLVNCSSACQPAQANDDAMRTVKLSQLRFKARHFAPRRLKAGLRTAQMRPSWTACRTSRRC